MTSRAWRAACAPIATFLTMFETSLSAAHFLAIQTLPRTDVIVGSYTRYNRLPITEPSESEEMHALHRNIARFA